MSRKHWPRLKNNDFTRLSLYQAVQGTHTDQSYKLKVKKKGKVLLKVEANRRHHQFSSRQ